jgi:hypothetical protein
MLKTSPTWGWTYSVHIGAGVTLTQTCLNMMTVVKRMSSASMIHFNVASNATPDTQAMAKPVQILMSVLKECMLVMLIPPARTWQGVTLVKSTLDTWVKMACIPAQMWTNVCKEPSTQVVRNRSNWPKGSKEMPYCKFAGLSPGNKLRDGTNIVEGDWDGTNVVEDDWGPTPCGCFVTAQTTDPFFRITVTHARFTHNMRMGCLITEPAKELLLVTLMLPARRW